MHSLHLQFQSLHQCLEAVASFQHQKEVLLRSENLLTLGRLSDADIERDTAIMQLISQSKLQTVLDDLYLIAKHLIKHHEINL